MSPMIFSVRSICAVKEEEEEEEEEEEAWKEDIVSSLEYGLFALSLFRA